MTVNASGSTQSLPPLEGELPQLVAHAPAAADQDSPDKLSAARGLVIGVGICAVFWGGVAAVVLAASN